MPGLGADGDRHQAPDDHDDAHDRRRPHDLQGLVARLVDALDVHPPEVDRHHDRDRRREPVLVGHQGAVGPQLEQVVEQADEVLAGRDAADRTGQDVVEQERRDRQPGQPAPHRLLDDAVDAAAHEHRAALDVDAAHAVAEEHDRQDEPGGRLADLRLDDPADVVGRAGQVAEDDGRRPPERDEREHHAGDDQHLAGRRAASLRSRCGDSSRTSRRRADSREDRQRPSAVGSGGLERVEGDKWMITTDLQRRRQEEGERRDCRRPDLACKARVTQPTATIAASPARSIAHVGEQERAALPRTAAAAPGSRGPIASRGPGESTSSSTAPRLMNGPPYMKTRGAEASAVSDDRQHSHEARQHHGDQRLVQRAGIHHHAHKGPGRASRP